MSSASAALSRAELARYSRHLLLPEFGRAGQERLKAGRVLVVGTGGLGCPAALYLAAAGVGTLGLVEFDRVDLSNLQRQILHSDAGVGRPKLASASEALGRINPHVRLVGHETRLNAANARDILAGYDVVVDGTDNFATRYLINDACVLLNKPNVSGSVLRFLGMLSVYHWQGGPCYRCLYPEPPPPDQVPSCAEAGVLGVLPGVIGTLQATEAIKLLTGIGHPLSGRLLRYNALELSFRELRLERDPACPVCGTHPRITALRDEDAAACAVPAALAEITPEQLQARLASGAPVQVLDVREPAEWELGHLPGAPLHLPLGSLAERLGELDAQAETVVCCRSGRRSAQACQMLRQAGFVRVANLEGGLLAWARDVDPSLPL